MGSYRLSREVDYFGLLINIPDKLKVVKAHQEVIEIVQASLERHNLLQRQSKGQGDVSTYKFKLHGHPFQILWSLDGSDHADNVKRFFCDLLASLFSAGWISVISSDLTRHLSNSTLIFRKGRSYPENRGETNQFLCVSPSSDDKLSLINIPKEFAEDLVKEIASLWDLQDQKRISKDETTVSYRLKMSGTPWFNCSGQDATQLRILILHIIRFLRQRKYKLKVNANLKGRADALFFQYDANQHSSPEDLFIVYLSKNDRLRLLETPDYIIDLVRDEITQNWDQGLQEERHHKGSFEFKLRGNPWWATGTETTESRFLMANIISRLRSKGWEVNGSLDISRRKNDKSVFVFRQGPPVDLPWLCLSFHEEDKIRYMAQSGVDARNIIERHLDVWNGEKLVQRTRNYGRSFEWKMNGRPFSGPGAFGSSRDQALILRVLMNILHDLDLHGWTLIASADISSKFVKNGPVDAHSWFFLWEGDLRWGWTEGKSKT